MRLIAGGALVLAALVFVVLAVAGSVGQADLGDAAAGALLLACPVAALGVWLAVAPRGRGARSHRRWWHTPLAVLLGTFGLAAVPLVWRDGAGSFAAALLAAPAGAVLWWWATHYTDAPPQPATVVLPDGSTERGLRYTVPPSKQLVVTAGAVIGSVVLGALAVATSRIPGPLWWLPAVGAVGCLWAVARTGGRLDDEAGLALSPSGVSFRRHEHVVLVPWDALDRAEVVDLGGLPLVHPRVLGLSVHRPDRIQGRVGGVARVARATPSGLAWPTWLFDTDACSIVDHIEVLLDEPDARPGLVDIAAASGASGASEPWA